MTWAVSPWALKAGWELGSIQRNFGRRAFGALFNAGLDVRSCEFFFLLPRFNSSPAHV